MQVRSLSFIGVVLILLCSISGMVQAKALPLPEVCHDFVADIPATDDKDYSDYPFADGMLWKVSKNGNSNYVYGTIHTQDQRATRFSPKVRLGIFQTQTYLMEIQLSQESNDIFQKNMFYQDGKSLKSQISPDLLAMLQSQIVDYGFTAKQAETMKPWAVFSTIGTPKPVRALTLDQVLMNYAQSRGHEIIGIESMQELVDTLQSIKSEDQLTIMTDTICNRSKIIRDSWELVQMHMFNNLRGIVAFNEEPHHDENIFQRYMNTMVYERNHRIFSRILPYFEQGKSFAAIGALHLPGEKGLLQKFADAGFSVEVIE